jgi:regulator of protease activity HflC (stomatin/prohibitin superfamily)
MKRRAAVPDAPQRDERWIKMERRLIYTRHSKKSSTQGFSVRIPGVAWMVWLILATVSVILALWFASRDIASQTIGLTVVGVNLVALYTLFAIKVADQWDKAVVLRFGRFIGLRGPGLFWVVPVLDRIPMWIDHRVMVTPFSAEKTLTRDTVPVDVDAVLFWLVWDAEKASLEVEDYQVAIAWAAQTALREVIGQMELADILVGRARMDRDLQKIIDERTTPWGVTVQSVEIRDIVIPQDLEDAMSRQAQAERERQARVILGESELQIAQSFADASLAYHNNPTALHLRAMNMLFEGLKERGAMVIVPSSAVDTMNLGGIAGLTSLAASPLAGFSQDKDAAEGD